MANRPIDSSMAINRPEKIKIREEWGNIALTELSMLSGKHRPLYVTLSGAEGKDIEVLIQNGVLKRTENGAISSDDQWKVIAIEKNGPAASELRSKYPGLDIRNDDVINLIHGCSETSFPNRGDDNFNLWTAQIINLDYNSRFEGKLENGRGLYEIAQTLKKISAIQHEMKNSRWSILLTLNANIELTQSCWSEVKQTLNDNLTSVDKFKEDFSKILPLDAGGRVNCDLLCKIKTDATLQQKLIVALVPKFFMQKIRDHRWEVSEIKSFVYGNNTSGRARMSSWVITLQKPDQVKSDDQCYSENVSKILSNCFQIQDDGTLVDFS